MRCVDGLYVRQVTTLFCSKGRVVVECTDWTHAGKLSQSYKVSHLLITAVVPWTKSSFLSLFFSLLPAELYFSTCFMQHDMALFFWGGGFNRHVKLLTTAKHIVHVCEQTKM